MDSDAPVTELLKAWGHGDSAALEDLICQIYTELRRMCRRTLKGEQEGHSLQPTSLVHEVYLRLLSLGEVSFESRRPFFAFAARLMRRVLVEHARAAGALKRGGGAQRIQIEPDHLPNKSPTINIVALDTLLGELEERDPIITRIIELRFFTGLQEKEVAETLGISRSRVQREWRFAKRWLASRLG